MKETTFSVLTYSEFLPIFVFLLFALALSVIILGASYVLAYQGGDTEKLTAYECGFDPFEDARNQFDVRFYLVAILFIIFDLEASFLFPWAVSLGKIGAMGFWTMFDFLLELCVGFIYAWKIGALEWQLLPMTCGASAPSLPPGGGGLRHYVLWPKSMIGYAKDCKSFHCGFESHFGLYRGCWKKRLGFKFPWVFFQTENFPPI